MRLRPIENPCPNWNKHSRWADRPSQSWNCIIGLVLIPWGMQLSIRRHLAILVSLFLSVFRLIIRSVSWISFSFHAHLRSTAKPSWPVGAGGQRWQCLGGRPHGKLPGWQHLPCGNPGHVPDETRCPGRAPVDPPARWFGRCSCSGSAGGLGATLFFLRYLVTFHGAKLLSGVDVPSHVEWHHHLNGSISWVTLQGLISRISQVSHGSLSDEFRLNRQSRIMSWMLGTWNS